jgi:DNA-binding CsgD family transcriptional regulator
MLDHLAGDGGLRPIERVVMRLHRSGAGAPEIGMRVGKKPGTVQRIIEMVDLKRHADARRTIRHDPLRPIERVVMNLRARGESYGEIGNRLARSGRQVQMIERYAVLKLEG